MAENQWSVRGLGRDRVHSLDQAERLAKRTGVLAVFPSDCKALPSLWEAVTGTRQVSVFRLDERGRRVLTAQLEHVWSLKNELAEQRRACVGKHLRGRLTVVSLRAVPLVYARTGRAGRVDDFDEPEQMPRLELELARALRDGGPATGPELRRLVGSRSARATKRALESLQHRFVVTQAGESDQPAGWPAAVFDLVARRYSNRLIRLPDADAALAELAAMLLSVGGELSAVDVARIIGTSRTEAATALDRLAEEGRAGRRRQGRSPVYKVDTALR